MGAGVVFGASAGVCGPAFSIMAGATAATWNAAISDGPAMAEGSPTDGTGSGVLSTGPWGPAIAFTGVTVDAAGGSICGAVLAGFGLPTDFHSTSSAWAMATMPSATENP